jgi:hypothetical protein
MASPVLDRAAARRLTRDAEVLSARLLPQGRFNICWSLTGSDRSYLLKLNNREGEAHLRQVAAAMTDAAARGSRCPGCWASAWTRTSGPTCSRSGFPAARSLKLAMPMPSLRTSGEALPNRSRCCTTGRSPTSR